MVHFDHPDRSCQWFCKNPSPSWLVMPKLLVKWFLAGAGGSSWSYKKSRCPRSVPALSQVHNFIFAITFDLVHLVAVAWASKNLASMMNNQQEKFELLKVIPVDFRAGRSFWRWTRYGQVMDKLIFELKY